MSRYFGQRYFKANYFAARFFHGVSAVVEAVSGGWFYKGHPWIDGPLRRYADTVEPEVVEAVIEVVEKCVVPNTDWETPHVAQAAAERSLREFLNRQKQEWKELYAQLIRLEYERREQEFEDFQIAMLLFDM